MLVDMMTLTEAAAVLGLAPSTLRQQLTKGRLRGRKVGPIWTVTPSEVERYRSASLGRIGRPFKSSESPKKTAR